MGKKKNMPRKRKKARKNEEYCTVLQRSMNANIKIMQQQMDRLESRLNREEHMNRRRLWRRAV
jgi:hypothetical protein